MMQKVLLFIFPIIFISFLGCTKEWQNPNTALPAKELEIRSILAHPNIYDSAGVIVEGKVWDLTFNILKEKGTETPYTSFKLADKDGNYVNVFALGHIPISEGGIVKVVGIYRREFKTEGYSFVNEIEAKRIEDRYYSTH
jgi:hypothetical protein